MNTSVLLAPNLQDAFGSPLLELCPVYLPPPTKTIVIWSWVYHEERIGPYTLCLHSLLSAVSCVHSS